MADSNTDHTKPVHVVGPYAVYGRLAAGGMATVHLGRVIDPTAEVRTVAIKRLHPQFSKDPEFVAMFIDEAKLAARVKHPNVVDTLTTLTMGQELLLVMEYIRGECFSKLLRAARRKNLHPSVPVVGTIIAGMLRGLHAAHEVKDDDGNFLNVVHRDISPQNVMIGTDGIAKVLDFGVAKASARIQITRDGQMKGKLSYMSPEQLQGKPVDRRADVFACGVVLWEALTRKRLFVAEEAGEVMAKILREEVPAPSTFAPGLSPELDAVVLRALHKDNTKRYQTAEELAVDLEKVIDVASPEGVGEWIESVAGEILGKRARLLADIESTPIDQSLANASKASFEDSTEFEELQSWAEREAARVIAQEDLKKFEALKGSVNGQSVGVQSGNEEPTVAGGSALPGGIERGAEKHSAAAAADSADSLLDSRNSDSEPPTTVSLPPGLPEGQMALGKSGSDESEAEEFEDKTAITLTVDPELAAALRAERETIAPEQPRPPPLPPHLQTPAKPVRRSRWGVVISMAAVVLGLAVVVFVQVQDGSSPLGDIFSSDIFSNGAQKRVRALLPRAERARTVAERRSAAEGDGSVGRGSASNAAKTNKPVDEVRGLSVSDLAMVDEPRAEKPATVYRKEVYRKEARTVAVVARKAVTTRRRKSVPKVVNTSKRTAGRKAREAAAAAQDCQTPYWVDERGIKRLKVACL